MKKRLFLVISWLLVLCCMGLIFFFSSQVSEKSSQTSGRTLKIIMNVISPFIEDFPETQRFNVTETIHVIIRKTAHATIYMILAVLLSNALYMQNYFFSGKYNKRDFFKLDRENKMKVYRNSLFAFLITFLYACSDEFHQLFVDGRSCEFRDVMIDSTGALAGIFIYFLIFRMVNKKLSKINLNSY